MGEGQGRDLVPDGLDDGRAGTWVLLIRKASRPSRTIESLVPVSRPFATFWCRLEPLASARCLHQRGEADPELDALEAVAVKEVTAEAGEAARSLRR